MGGKNHAPCNRFLARSTAMSLAHSMAGISLEQANVHLEHILLKELNGEKARMWDFLCGMSNFNANLAGIKAAIGMLRQQMKDENYTDLPTIQSADLDLSGARMAREGMIARKSFDDALAVYRSGTFYAVLDCFDVYADEIDKLAETLQARAQSCEDACSRGKLQDELEENGAGNLRPDFAKLYTAWGRFNAFFLASSLVSTEAYYMANGFGTLVPVTQVKAIAVPA